MYRIKYDILNEIINGHETIFNGDEIISVDGISFDDFIKSYADINKKKLLSFGFQYDYGIMSLNDLAIREYTLYPNTTFLPISDAMLGLMSNFIDEYDSGIESSSFLSRCYEVFKLLSDEMKEDTIILFDEE